MAEKRGKERQRVLTRAVAKRDEDQAEFGNTVADGENCAPGGVNAGNGSEDTN